MLERDLCYIEEYYYYRRSYFSSGGFSIHGEYSIDISLSFLYKALKRMIEEYPQLSLQIFEDRDNHGNLQNKKVRFLDSYKFKDLVEVLDVDLTKIPVEQVLRDISAICFKFNEMNKPLWGVKFIRPNNVIFYCDHVFYDGISGFNFHQILRDTFNSIIFQEERMRRITDVPDYSDSEVYTKELYNYNSRLFNEIPPATTTIVDYNPTLRYLLNVVYKVFCPKFIQRWIAKLSNTITRATNPFITKVIYKYYNKTEVVKDEHLNSRLNSPIGKININPENLQKLLNKCKTENVKLTALLMAISHIAILPISKEKDVKNNIPVNLRGIGKYPVGQREFKFEFGLYVSAIDFKVPSLGSIFPNLYSKLFNWNEIEEEEEGEQEELLTKNIKLDWSIPRYFQQYMEKELPTTHQLFGSLQLLKVSDYIKVAGTTPDMSTLVLSNLGSLKKSNSENKVQITDLIFSQASNHFCGYISINVIGTDVNGVNIVATGLPKFDKEFGLFMSLYEKTLNDIIDDLE